MAQKKGSKRRSPKPNRESKLTDLPTSETDETRVKAGHSLMEDEGIFYFVKAPTAGLP